MTAPGNLLGIFTSVMLKLSGEYWSITSVPLSRCKRVLDHPRSVDGDGFDLLLRLAEYDAALRG